MLYNRQTDRLTWHGAHSYQIMVDERNMAEDKTAIILNTGRKQSSEREYGERPTLFVCQSHIISEYRLDGYQTLGRPSNDMIPDIPVQDRFVSKSHGFFETEHGETHYTAMHTTNGIKYKGSFLSPWTKISLKDGDELIIPSDDNEAGHSVIIVFAATPARINLWRELQRASRDKLTGLCGRDSFMTWWEQNHARKDYENAVFFIMDVDDFKVINDSKGHNAGDEVLRIVADQLKSIVRYENQVCRWGGDEFVGIIPGTADSAAARLGVLSRGIRERTEEAGLPVTVSIGYVNIRKAGDTRDIIKIMELADSALYRMKQDGKGGIASY